MPAELQPTNGTAEQRRALAAWLAVTAPGMLLTRTIVLGALIVAPRWHAPVWIAPAAQPIAAALLALHGAVALLLMRVSERAALVVLGIAMCVADAVACGVLIGADGQLRGPGGALLVLPCAMSFAAIGWKTLIPTSAGVLAGMIIAWQAAVAPVILAAPPLSFPTVLSVEIFYRDAPALSGVVAAAPTALSVETAFAGTPVDAQAQSFPTVLSVEPTFGSFASPSLTAALFLPLLAIGLGALCIGSGWSLMRVRRIRAAVVADMIAEGRLI